MLVVALAATAEALPKQQLANRANAICLKYENKAKKATHGKLAVVLPRVFRIAKQQQRALGALKPARSVAGLYRRFLGDNQDGVDVIARMKAAAVAGDKSAFTKASRDLTTVDKSVNADAKRLGAPHCGDD